MQLKLLLNLKMKENFSYWKMKEYLSYLKMKEYLSYLKMNENWREEVPALVA